MLVRSRLGRIALPLLTAILAYVPLHAASLSTWLDSSGLDEFFIHPMAPPLSLTDLYGAPLSLDDYRGSVVIVTFIDKKSRQEAIEWVETLPSSYLGRPGLVFVNMVFPGGISFLVPRRKVIAGIRSEIATVHRSLRASLDPADRERLDRTTIRWAADWERRHSRRWGVMRHRVNVFVIDPGGRLRTTLRGMSDRTRKILDATLSTLLPGSLRSTAR